MTPPAEPATLRDVQRWMRQRIRPAGGSSAVPAAARLNLQRGVPGEERLAVYADGYLARMQEALAEVYEAVHHVLGERAFAGLAQAYARQHPSHDYNLSLAGRHLPEFLAGHPLSRDLPFLPDLARLEWLVCQAFHAFDRPPLRRDEVAALSLDAWALQRVRFQPSVGLLASAWPVRDVWAARQQPRDQIRIELIHRPQRVLVHRREAQVVCELLEEPQHLLLQALLAGQPLGAACRALADESAAGAELPVAAWFARWARQGLITGCTS